MADRTPVVQTQRTVEDERRDLLAYLRAFDRGSYNGGSGEISAFVRIIIERIKRGEHEGASDQ